MWIYCRWRLRQGRFRRCDIKAENPQRNSGPCALASGDGTAWCGIAIASYKRGCISAIHDAMRSSVLSASFTSSRASPTNLPSATAVESS